MHQSKENKGLGVPDLAGPAFKACAAPQTDTESHIEEDTPICGECVSQLINHTEVDMGLCGGCFPSAYWIDAHTHTNACRSAHTHTPRGLEPMRGWCATSFPSFYPFEIIEYYGGLFSVSVVDLSVGLPVDCRSGGRESAGLCVFCGVERDESGAGECWGCWSQRHIEQPKGELKSREVRSNAGIYREYSHLWLSNPKQRPAE